MEYTFSVWAPNPTTVTLSCDGRTYPMTKTEDNVWSATCDVEPESRYGFLLDDDPKIYPDPRSSRQPDGVHGLSQLYSIDPQSWTDQNWTGRQLAGGIIYELHVGTFTPAGTFDGVIEKLMYLKNLGVDFIELMPINDYNGERGWGYDGVLWYCVHEQYGGPDGLVRLVNAAHNMGIGVILDVVYNHLGPSGNYLPLFGPYTTAGRNTWGDLINISGEHSDPVREYIIGNALRWMDYFHIDGLRLDAVHALYDVTAIHILEELARKTEILSQKLGKPLTLIAESDLNDPLLITPLAAHGYGLTAQWDDDVHHAIHTAVSGERQGYYSDFGSIATLAKVFTEAFFHAGTYSSFRKRRHGRPIDRYILRGHQFIVYTCNHDQIGNRAIGDRPSQNLSISQLVLKAALVIFSPFTPMLFMGEEWAANTPFQFFTSHPEPELAAATAEGRKKEFADHGWNAEVIPDPGDITTFENSKLCWDELPNPPHALILMAYITFIRYRKQLWQFSDDNLTHISTTYDEDAGWLALHRNGLTIVYNISHDTITVPFTGTNVVSWGKIIIDQDSTTIPAYCFVILA